MILFAQNVENTVRLPFAMHNSCASEQSFAQKSLYFVRFEKNNAQRLCIHLPLRTKEARYCASA